MTRRMIWVICGLAVWAAVWAGPVRAASPVVHALLFYAPGCPDCDQVLTQDLPPLLNKYGPQLHILEVDVTGVPGRNLYQAAIKQFKIPFARWGVPTLIVSQTVMVGADEIPAQFPGLIDSSLAQGGAAWPPLTGLVAMLPPDQTPVTPATSADSFSARLARDPIGTVLAVVVLVTMCVALGYTLVIFLRPAPELASVPARRRGKTPPAAPPPPAWQLWAVPLLSLVGLGVAGYLAYVEVTRTTAACVVGGGCDTVQQSAYARLFGVIPVGVLGIVGYVMILAAWGVSRFRGGRVADWSTLAVLGLTLFGTLFSDRKSVV
jgi:uncharacterized membrane protein/thiol-disulfide isomerase/thioredoxin